MAAKDSIWAQDPSTQAERDNRLQLGLLRTAVENLKSMRPVVPLFGLAILSLFSQSTPLDHRLAWYGQMLLGFIPHLIVLARFPDGVLPPEKTRRWTRIVAAANLFLIANWGSMGFWLWDSHRPDANPVMVQMVVAATMAAHAANTGACRAIARPALLIYLAAMLLVPMQGLIGDEPDTRFILMALAAPVYVAFMAMVGRRNETRARAAITLIQERDSLLAELVMAKLESDRGRERAEAASVAKSQFLANMSHELRTPLNAILGFSELIGTRIFHKQPERNYEYANLINSSGKHLLALINDILDLAKIEAGRWKLQEHAIDLHVTARDALQLVMWRARDGDVTLVNAIPSDLDLLYGDERAIKQILLNLLSNSVKFTPGGGTVTAFAHGGDGAFCLGVRDTGVGIAPEDQARVFDSFGQGKHDIAVADKGTGLGLAIVKGLVEAHGGSISLESQVGQGTCVTVRLSPDRLRLRPLAQTGQLTAALAG